MKYLIWWFYASSLYNVVCSFIYVVQGKPEELIYMIPAFLLTLFLGIGILIHKSQQ